MKTSATVPQVPSTLLLGTGSPVFLGLTKWARLANYKVPGLESPGVTSACLPTGFSCLTWVLMLHGHHFAILNHLLQPHLAFTHHVHPTSRPALPASSQVLDGAPISSPLFFQQLHRVPKLSMIIPCSCVQAALSFSPRRIMLPPRSWSPAHVFLCKAELPRCGELQSQVEDTGSEAGQWDMLPQHKADDSAMWSG